MKIRMKTLEAGPGGVFQVGSVRDMDEKAAKARVDGGYAEYVSAPVREEAQAPEAAVIAPPERAVMPKPRPRAKR
jgi:hypothetical protein